MASRRNGQTVKWSNGQMVRRVERPNGPAIQLDGQTVKMSTGQNVNWSKRLAVSMPQRAGGIAGDTAPRSLTLTHSHTLSLLHTHTYTNGQIGRNGRNGQISQNRQNGPNGQNSQNGQIRPKRANTANTGKYGQYGQIRPKRAGDLPPAGGAGQEALDGERQPHPARAHY